MSVAGFGFRQGATRESLADALRAAGGAAGVMRVATVAGKAEAPVFKDFAAALAVAAEAVEASRLPAAKVLTASAKSEAMYGTGSLSEAVALIVAGPGARLLGPRVISADRMATCAIAVAGDER